MANPVALLHFRLEASHGIGRAELLELWSSACRSNDVAVSRAESGSDHRKMHTYSLLGPTKNLNIEDATNRMHDFLSQARPKATILLRRY